MKETEWDYGARQSLAAVLEQLRDVPRGAITWDYPHKCVAAFANDGHSEFHLNYLRSRLNEELDVALLKAKTSDAQEGSFSALIYLEDRRRVSDWLWDSWDVINGKDIGSERDPERDKWEQICAAFPIELQELSKKEQEETKP